MQYIKRILILWALGTVVFTAKAQILVKGNVVNERGESVEYVSIGFEADSVGTISDAEGQFAIVLPADRRKDLLFSHVAYQPEKIPYAVYAQDRGDLTIVLKDKVVGLTEVVIGKDPQLKTIVGKGVVPPAAIIGLSGTGHQDAKEWGFVFQNRHDYMISDILLTVSSCKFLKCTLSMNLYEVHDGQFVNILNKPLYQKIYKSDGKRTLDFVPEETLLLKRRTKYFVSISCVDTYDEENIIYFPCQFRNSYIRVMPEGEKEKLPVGPVIVVKGYEVKESQG